MNAIRDAQDKVAKASQAIGTALYADAGANAAGGPGSTGGPSAGGDDDVVDAEVVDDEPEARSA